VTFASTDRVALDAVGVAALKMHGTTRKIEGRKVFEQDQIRRAAELDLGASASDDIEIVPIDEGTKGIAERIGSHLTEWHGGSTRPKRFH